MRYLLSVLLLFFSLQTSIFAAASSEWGFIEYNYTNTLHDSTAKRFKHYGCLELPRGTNQKDAKKILLKRFITDRYADQNSSSNVQTWTKTYNAPADTYYFLACENIVNTHDGKPVCNDAQGLSMFKSLKAKSSYAAYQKIMQQYGNGELVRFCFNYQPPGSKTSINPNSIIGTLTGKKGDKVSAKSPNGAVRTLSVGDAIYGNDTIQTAEGSAAVVMFTDGTAVTMAPNSELDIYESTNESFKGRSDSGLFEWATGLISKLNPSGFKLHAKTVAIGIRGTKFFLDINKTYTKELTTEGIVTVSEGSGTLEVKKGFKITKDDRTKTWSRVKPIDPKVDGRYVRIFNDLKQNMQNINDDFFKGELQ